MRVSDGLLNEAERHQGVAEPHARLLLLDERPLQLLEGDQPVAKQDFAQLVGGGCYGGRTQLIGNGALT